METGSKEHVGGGLGSGSGGVRNKLREYMI